MIYTHLAAALVALALGFAAGWQTQGWRWGAAEAKRLQSEQRDQFVRIERADRPAVRHESTRAALQRRGAQLDEEIAHVVQNSPAYRDGGGQCLDADGVRIIRAALDGADDSGEPAAAVPAASAPR